MAKHQEVQEMEAVETMEPEYSEAELLDQQTADINAAWVTARLMRLPLDHGGESFRCLIVIAGRVAADFRSIPDDRSPDGISIIPTNAVGSMVGDYVTEKGLREDGYLPGRDIHYNRITGEFVRYSKPPRTRKPSVSQ